jgi:hypothetical protein
MLRWMSVLFGGAVLLALAGAGYSLPIEDKCVKIVHVESGKILGIEGDSEENVSQAVLAADENKESRQWKIEKDGEHLKIVHRKCGKVLDVNEVSGDEGAKIILYDSKDSENDNQRWEWVGTGEGKRLKSKSSSLVLDIDGEGKVIQKKEDSENKKQLWKVVEIK